MSRPITEASIRERLAADRAGRACRLPTWEEVEYLLERLTAQRRETALLRGKIERLVMLATETLDSIERVQIDDALGGRRAFGGMVEPLAPDKIERWLKANNVPIPLGRIVAGTLLCVRDTETGTLPRFGVIEFDAIPAHVSGDGPMPPVHHHYPERVTFEDANR